MKLLGGIHLMDKVLPVPACNQDLCLKAGGLGWSWRVMLAQAAIYPGISLLSGGAAAMNH